MNNPKRVTKLDGNSGVYAVLNVIASKWAISIIRILQDDTLRFHEIHKALPGTRQKVLTDTLRKLERNGIAQRAVYPTVPPQVEYKLTPLGLDLLKLSMMLTEWIVAHEEEIGRAQRAYDRRRKP